MVWIGEVWSVFFFPLSVFVFYCLFYGNQGLSSLLLWRFIGFFGLLGPPLPHFPFFCDRSFVGLSHLVAWLVSWTFSQTTELLL